MIDSEAIWLGFGARCAHHDGTSFLQSAQPANIDKDSCGVGASLPLFAVTH